MDDPISALDANVKKKIFKLVFMRKLSDKTRVLVTHAVDFLHLADTIICLKNGKVVFKGSYDEVKDNAYLKELYAIHKSHQKEQESIQSEGTKADDSKKLEVSKMIDTDDKEEEEIKETTLDDVPTDSDVSDDDGSNSEIREENLRKKSGRSKQRSYSIGSGEQTDNQKK